jgi:hypothetical protein
LVALWAMRRLLVIDTRKKVTKTRNVSFFICNVFEEYYLSATSSNVRGRHKNIQNKNIYGI